MKITSRLFGVLILGAVLFGASPSPAQQYDLDPPENPPLTHTVRISQLEFTTDVDDGTNGVAELIVRLEVPWGGDHGTTEFVWAEEHNFDDGPPPWSAADSDNPIPVGSHTECTEALDPVFVFDAFESDAGIDPLVSALAAVGGGAAGGAVGFVVSGPGAAAAAGAGAAALTEAVTLSAQYFNDDDELFQGDYSASGSFDRVEHKNQEGCEASTAQHSFQETTGLAYANAAELVEDSSIADQLRTYHRHGVDTYHPFGRSAEYASKRYDHLLRALGQADTLEAENGESANVDSIRSAVRTHVTEIAGLVADSLIAEAETLSVNQDTLRQARHWVEDGDHLVSQNQWTDGVEAYKEGVTLLLPAMFPDFEGGLAVAAPLPIELPTESRLAPNYPNPFNPSTVISYALSRRQEVTLEIYTPLGRHVRTLVDGVQSAGGHRVLFEAQGLSSGVYLYRLKTADGYVETRKMTLVQ